MKTIHNEPKKRISLHTDDGTQVGEIEYMTSNTGELYAIRTAVFEGHQGRGYGTQLLDALVAYARGRGSKVVPICPFVKAIFEKQPDKYGDVAQMKK